MTLHSMVLLSCVGGFVKRPKLKEFYSFEGQDRFIYEELVLSDYHFAGPRVFVEIGGSDGLTPLQPPPCLILRQH